MIINSQNFNEFLPQIKQGKIWLLNIKHARSVGHLTGEINSWLLEMKFGMRREQSVCVLAPFRLLEHKHFLKYVAHTKLIHVVFDEHLCDRLRPIFFKLGTVYFTNEYIMNNKRVSLYHQLHYLNRKNPSFFRVSKDDTEYLNEQLKKFGIDLSQYKGLVTLHTRRSFNRPQDRNEVNAYRNTHFSTYTKLSKYLSAMGYLILRLGDPEEFDYGEYIFDYASNRDKTDDRFDLAAICNSFFYIGCSSGLKFIGETFKIPSLLLNVAPYCDGGTQELSAVLFKEILDKKTGKILRFSEVMTTIFGLDSLFNLNYPDWHKRYEFKFNSSEDALEATKSFVKLIESNGEETSGMQRICDIYPSHNYIFFSPSYIYFQKTLC